MTAPLVHLGLGANLGDRRGNIEAALRELGETQGLQVKAVSALVETDALLPDGDAPPQPKYLNAVALIAWQHTPAQLLRRLREIEVLLGRAPQRTRWSARPIDLDILLWGDRVVDEPGLTVPHPELHRRRFVLGPMVELTPQARHPVLGRTAEALLAQLKE